MPDPLFENIPDGATISNIEPVASDPNIRRVKVNGRSVARLKASDVAALDLSVGQPWTEALGRAIQAAIAANRARKAALNLLGRRGYSRAELLDRLTRKGHDQTSARLAVEEMAAEGWIDEEEYARSVGRGVLGRKPAGHRLLVQRMVARRIDRDLARRVAEELLLDTNLVEAAAGLARKRLRAMKGIGPAATRRRLTGLLARRGFDSEIIQEALREVEGNFDDQPAVE